MRNYEDICDDIKRTPQSSPSWKPLLKELSDHNESLDVMSE